MFSTEWEHSGLLGFWTLSSDILKNITEQSVLETRSTEYYRTAFRKLYLQNTTGQSVSETRPKEHYRTQGFGNLICFRPQVRGRETPTLLGPLEYG
jgi:hypothetical protein